MKFVKSFALAAAVAAAAVSAKAQANDSDLIIGFKTATGTGKATNVEVDLGTFANLATNYTSTVSGSTVTYDLGNLANSLSATYGSTWASSTEALVYGVVGTHTDIATNNVTNWITSKWTSTTNAAGVAANSVSPGTNSSDSALGITNSKIATVGSNASFSGLVGSTIAVGTTDTTSWSKNDPFNTATAKTDALVSSGYTDLYTVVSDGISGSYSFLGTFNISSTGELTFTEAAAVIPEPSTYAIVLGALCVGFVALRRRFSKAA